MVEKNKQSFSLPDSPCSAMGWEYLLARQKLRREAFFLVTGQRVEKFLGVPKLCFGTGEAASTAVSEALKDWGVHDKDVAMCFNTTSSNTSDHNGACMLLKKKIGQHQLSVTCRHCVQTHHQGDLLSVHETFFRV